MADNRTQQEKLKAKHPPVPTRPTTARQQDAKHQGAAKK